MLWKIKPIGIDKVSFSCYQLRKSGENIKYHPPVSIEKPFFKTHAPVSETGVVEEF